MNEAEELNKLACVNHEFASGCSACENNLVAAYMALLESTKIKLDPSIKVTKIPAEATQGKFVDRGKIPDKENKT